MTVVAIRHSWRTRAREAIAALAAFAGGVVAATAGGPVLPRVIGGVAFVLGTYWLVDALVLGSSWRLVADELKIPTILSRRRVVAGGDDLAVSASGRWFGVISVAGARGVRSVTANPLVSPSDLRSWFVEIADAESRGG